MINFVPVDKLLPILKSHGWNEEIPAGEYWFNNQSVVEPIVNEKYPNYGQTASLQLRWHTYAGEECRRQLIEHLSAFKKLSEEHFRSAVMPINGSVDSFVIPGKPILDLSSFRFDYQGSKFSLSDFQEMFNNSKIWPAANLNGITLKGLDFSWIKITNLSICHADLEGLKLSQVDMSDVHVSCSVLDKCRITLLKSERVTIHGSSFEGAFLNAVKFDEYTVGDGFKYAEVSQLYLTKALCKAWMKREAFNESFVNGQRHTIFLSNKIDDGTGPRGRKCREYIKWYEHVFDQLNKFGYMSLSERIGFSLSLLFTKCWSSYSVLAFMSLLIMLLYGGVFFVLPSDSFLGMSGFFSAIYFSVVTFTTLGYGDIQPLSILARVLAISEVFIGYILLGSFVFLIGHKASSRY